MGIFDANEIFEIAERIERNGAKFYGIAAKNTEDSQINQILLDLAAAEVEHERTFATMRADVQKQGQTTSSYTVSDPEGETIAYLQAIADGHIFDIREDPSEALTGEETAAEVFEMALEREKNSIIFYLGMKDMVSEKLGKDKISGIIKEEMNHVTSISRELAALDQ